MLFGNVLELKQICSRSTTTTLSSLRREGKKTYLIMLLLGHLKHRVDVWNEEKKMLGMGLINSVELWVCHFLGTKSCRRSKHAQIYKIKKKKNLWTLRLWGTNRLPLEARKEPLCTMSVWASLVRVKWTSLEVSGVGHCQTLKMNLQFEKTRQIWHLFWNLPLLNLFKIIPCLVSFNVPYLLGLILEIT